VLKQERDHAAAALGLARLLMNRNDAQEAADLLARLAPGGEHAEEAERLTAQLSLLELARDLGDEASARRRSENEPGNARLRMELGYIIAAAGRYEEALGMLLAAAEMDRKLAGSEIKEAMVKIFRVIGVRSQLADDYRDKLSRLLY
jgi:putative thioredoxin